MFLTKYWKVCHYFWRFHVFGYNNKFANSTFNCFCNLICTLLYFSALLGYSKCLIDWTDQVLRYLEFHIISLSHMYHPLGSFPSLKVIPIGFKSVICLELILFSTYILQKEH